MTSFVMLVATATVGIDYGWQPIAGGGFEYIIQIEPEMLDSLKSGEPIFSQLPPAYRGIRGLRIVVGDGPVPHHGEMPPAPVAPAAEKQPSLGDPRGAPPPGDTAKNPAENAGAADKTRPGPMAPDPNAKPPAAQTTAYQQSIDQTKTNDRSVAGPSGAGSSSALPSGDAGSPSDNPPQGFEAAGQASTVRPWVPESAAVVALFASVGANLFLVWLTISQRGRYRSMVARRVVSGEW